jgi:hypothetical protein
MAADDAAVVVRLQANLKDYEAALKSAVRATERAANAAEKAISNVGKGGGASSMVAANFNKSAGQIANDARMLQFQLNDIFSGIASGQGIRSVQMQLGQIAQQLSGGGLAQGARTFGAALVGMVNPINLAVVAFGVLATAAAHYFTSAEDDAKKAREELDKQATAIEKLAKEYGALFPELERIAKLRRDEANAAEKEEAKQAALAGAYEKTKKAIEGIPGDLNEIVNMLQLLGQPTEDVVALQEAFGTLSTNVDEHKASSAEAKGVVAALDKIIASSVGNVRTLAQAIRDQLVESFKELDRAAKSAGTTMQNALGISLPGAGGPMDMGPLIRARAGSPSAAKEFLKTKAASQAIADSLDRLDDDMAEALVELFSLLPSTAQITSGVRSYEEQARLYRAYKSGKGGLAAPPGQSRHEFGRAVDIGAGVSMDQLAAAVAQTEKLEQLKGRAYEIDKVHVQLAGTAAKVEQERVDIMLDNEEATAKALESAREWNVEAERKIALDKQVAEINAQVWLSEAERAAQVESLRIAEEHLAQLRKDGIPVTAEMERQIRALADAQAYATVKSQEAAERQKQFIDSQQKAAEQAKQFNQQMAVIIGGGLSSFVQDLIAGEDAGDAFANMLQRITSQLIDMFIQMMIIKPLMNSLFGGATGGGGISGLEAGGTVGLSGHPAGKRPAALWANAPRYATGGMVGLRPGEVPIIAHRGEIIVPNARRLAGNAAGGHVDNSVHQQNKISIDMMGSGYVAANSENAKQVGENIQKLIQAELVRESRPGGLLRKVPH